MLDNDDLFFNEEELLFPEGIRDVVIKDKKINKILKKYKVEKEVLAKYIAGMIFYKYLLDIKSGAAKILEDGTIISAFEKMLLTADYDTTYKDTRRYIQIQRERLLSDISKSALEKLNKDISNEFKNYKHYYELGRKILNASLSTMFVPIKKNKKTRTKS